jgi:hypothetical protein
MSDSARALPCARGAAAIRHGAPEGVPLEQLCEKRRRLVGAIKPPAVEVKEPPRRVKEWPWRR